METLTLGWIADNIEFLLVLCAGIYAVYRGTRNGIRKLLAEEFKALNSRIDDMQKQMNELDLETCKNFLVRYLADVEKGAMTSEIEQQRFWEQYEHYKSKGGNTYIAEWVDKLKKKGWL